MAKTKSKESTEEMVDYGPSDKLPQNNGDIPISAIKASVKSIASHEQDPYLSQSEVAGRLGVSHTTVTNYIRAKLIAAEWRGPRLCIRESALAVFQGKNYEPPNKE